MVRDHAGGAPPRRELIERYGSSEYPHQAQGLRSPRAGPFNPRDRQNGQAHGRHCARPDPAADPDRALHRQPLAAHRQEEPRAVRNPHAQARARHRRPHPADRGRADEARPVRRRGRRDQAVTGMTAMRTGVIAKKLGMTRFFDEAGAHVPVTILSLEGCQVVGQRTADKDGYVALQLGAGSRKAKNTSQADRGQFAKALVEPKRTVVEFRVSDDMLIDVGAELTADHFLPGQKVDVSGLTVGKGFAGGMKRWNFGGLRATHGVSLSHRSLGSTGNRQDPGKTFKNKKMAGHLGVEAVTTLNLTIFRVDVERGLIMIKGAVPGTEGSWVKIRDAIKKAAPAGVPTPGAYKKAGEEAKAEEAPAQEEEVITAAPADEAPAAEAA